MKWVSGKATTANEALMATNGHVPLNSVFAQVGLRLEHFSWISRTSG